jgi:hypothetical protein
VTVLSICTGMGLLDRAFMDAGFRIAPGCEIDASKRAMYEALMGHAGTLADRLGGDAYMAHDLADLPRWLRGHRFEGVIGGPSCQSHSKLRAMRAPKFPDLTPLVLDLLEAVEHDWFCFENVVPIAIPGAVHTRCNAMHFYRPHQSRVRWFTHSPNIVPPPGCVQGQCRRPHGLPGRGRADLRAEARRAVARLPGRGEAAVPLRAAAARAGRRGAVPAGAGLGERRQGLDG